MRAMQVTVAKKIRLEGVGLHSGQPVTVEILPAPANEGITFRRADVALSRPISASVDNVSSTELSTCIGQGVERIATIEHLMSALAGLMIDNARILVRGSEIPILDGSARPFVEAIQAAGIKQLKAPRQFVALTREFTLRDGDRYINAIPYNGFALRYAIEFDSKAIGAQTVDLELTRSGYRDICSARTFCHARDIEAMRSVGLAKGGSLANAVVVDDSRVINEEGLRCADEFVRHKALDFVGDLALFGQPILARFEVFKGGHALHAKFVRELCKFRSDLFVATADVVERQEVPAVNPAFGSLLGRA
jgi:UDP-3-O-[3-hydroxymyristoyl] N-acetylglucosamine deacetylase